MSEERAPRSPAASTTSSTVAIPGFALDHVNVTPLMAFPYWSRPTAANCCVLPIRIEDVVGVTVMPVRTGGGGSTVRTAGALLMPEADAVIDAEPFDVPTAKP